MKQKFSVVQLTNMLNKKILLLKKSMEMSVLFYSFYFLIIMLKKAISQSVFFSKSYE